MQTSISIDQLTVGLYIHLDLHWMDHPFSFGSFKIKSDDQIRTLRSLGLQEVRYDPAKSDVTPLVAAAPPAAILPAPPRMAPVDPAMLLKRERQERLKRHRDAVARVEKNYRAASATVRNLPSALQASPAGTLEKTGAFVDQLAADFLADNEVAIHVIGAIPGTPDLHVHPLNVAVLSLMLARGLELAPDQARLLGQGALFHDIGLQEVPSRILLNTEPLSAAERAARELHCEHGVRMGKACGLPPALLDIIEHHHELADGSGYPQRLKGEAIALLPRIVAVVNQYDNLCNPVNIARALTPHEALAHMFAQQRGKFDARIMQVMIRCLGVYPPGTIVSLSDGSVCLVTSVNTTRPLRPTVVVYDPRTAREQPIILDLGEEPDLNISKALRPAQAAREAVEYLSVRSRMSYYFDAGPAR